MIYKGDLVGGKDRSQRRTCRLQFYITAAEYKRLVYLAKRQTMTMSAFVRAQAIYQKIPCRITPIARKSYITLGALQSDLIRMRRILEDAASLVAMIKPEQKATFTTLKTQLSALEARVRQVQSEVINLPTTTASDKVA